MKCENKRIVITGGTSGIGYRMVERLHPGNQVIVIARDEKKLFELSRQCKGIITYRADLSQPTDVETVATEISKRFGTIDILINNAGIQHTPRFTDKDFQYSSISKEIAVNLTSICCLTYLMLPAMLHEDRAVILNVNSGLALAPKTSSAVYCATKGALNIFTQSLRYQLEQSNISVQQVFPELVDTPMTEGRGAKKMAADEAARRIIDGIERDIPDHYIGKVRLLRLLLRLIPSVAKRIMKRY